MLALAKHGGIHQYPNTGDVEARGSGVRGKTRLYEIRGIVFFLHGCAIILALQKLRSREITTGLRPVWTISELKTR